MFQVLRGAYTSERCFLFGTSRSSGSTRDTDRRLEIIVERTRSPGRSPAYGPRNEIAVVVHLRLMDQLEHIGIVQTARPQTDRQVVGVSLGLKWRRNGVDEGEANTAAATVVKRDASTSTTAKNRREERIKKQH